MIEYHPHRPFPYFRGIPRSSVHRSTLSKDGASGKVGVVQVVPPKATRLDPWDYNREIYKRRNEIEQLFRGLKGFRRIFSRFEKLDVIMLGFILFALINDALR